MKAKRVYECPEHLVQHTELIFPLDTQGGAINAS